MGRKDDKLLHFSFDKIPILCGGEKVGFVEEETYKINNPMYLQFFTLGLDSRK